MVSENGELGQNRTHPLCLEHSDRFFLYSGRGGNVSVCSVGDQLQLGLHTATGLAGYSCVLNCWVDTLLPMWFKKMLYSFLDENLHMAYSILTEISVRRMYAGLLSFSLCVDFLIIRQIKLIQDRKDYHASFFVSSLEVAGMSSDICVSCLLISGSGKESISISGNS